MNETNELEGFETINLPRPLKRNIKLLADQLKASRNRHKDISYAEMIDEMYGYFVQHHEEAKQ